MRKITLCLILLLLCSTAFAQKEKQAKEILDKASSTLKKAGGIKAEFNITAFGRNGKKTASEKGNIRIKGPNFILETSSSVSWFDGHTQWSYLIASDEVNISNPTSEELQSINPYSLLNIYRQGYDYKLGGIKTINGKDGYEVILIPTDSKQNIAKIVLFITKTYQPFYINIEQRDGSKSEIIVTSYQTGQSYPDSLFKFDKKKYPNTEIIDLR